MPTLSFADRRSASRVGYAIASRLGLASRLVAESKEMLPSKAVELVQCLDSLAEIRRDLRSRMRLSVSHVDEWVCEFQKCLKSLSRKA